MESPLVHTRQMTSSCGKGSEITQVPTLLLQHYQLLTVLMNETSSPSISLASPCSCGLEPAFCILSTGTLLVLSLYSWQVRVRPRN